MLGVDDNGYVRWLKHRYVTGEIEVEELEEGLALALRGDEEQVAWPIECYDWLEVNASCDPTTALRTPR
jgi:hypothetical protein